ncbi:MAG: outer membrane lipoprotein carrier protein LolA [Methylococcales bacterium]|nr:outer membrane lipoprotein carrier protein LolA [Methylococcales bacterium]MBT7410176.1 outer membrane lipoprotein carrier protein LolA [Methylococcales bacterium]
MCGFSISIFAQNELFKSPVADVSENIALRTISQLFQNKPIVRANFTQSKKIKILTRPLISSGSLLFSNDSGLYWKIKKPFSSIMILSEKGLTQLTNGEKKSLLKSTNSSSAQNFMNTFLFMFNGKFVEAERHFKLYFTQHKTRWTLGLIPKNKPISNVIKNIQFSGNQQQLLVNFKLRETSGDVTAIQFTDVRFQPILSAQEKNYFE